MDSMDETSIFRLMEEAVLGFVGWVGDALVVRGTDAAYLRRGVAV